MRDLDAWAHEVYVLMQRGRFRDAADALPPLIDAADEGGRADLCARSLTWLGEAHLQGRGWGGSWPLGSSCQLGRVSRRWHRCQRGSG